MDPQIVSLMERFINHGDWLQYAISFEATLICPVLHGSSPRIALSKLDFPDPTGPSKTFIEPALSAKVILCIAASLIIGAGHTVAFSVAMASSDPEIFCSVSSVLPSFSLVSEDKDDLFEESSTRRSCVEGDLKYACRRLKQPNAAASCGMTASNCSAGDVTRVMILKEAKAWAVFNESFPFTLAWIANTMKELAGAQILGKDATSVSSKLSQDADSAITKSVKPYNAPEKRPGAFQFLFSLFLDIARSAIAKSCDFNFLDCAEHERGVLHTLLDSFIPLLLILSDGFGNLTLLSHTNWKHVSLRLHQAEKVLTKCN